MKVTLGKDGIYAASQRASDDVLCIGEGKTRTEARLNCMEVVNDRHFSDAFLLGQRDCRDGKLANLTGGEVYTRGYSAQYQHEQNMTAMGLRSYVYH